MCDRYKLAGKQRIVFKAIGPEVGVSFTERDAVGEPFYGFCERVRRELKDWIAKLPESALRLSDLTDGQRSVLKMMRGPVPPQITVLADGLVTLFSEEDTTHAELTDASADTRDFPNCTQVWNDFRAKIDRHVDGVKAPLRTIMREMTKVQAFEGQDCAQQIVDALKAVMSTSDHRNPLNKIVAKLSEPGPHTDPLNEVTAAVVGKEATNLTEEDYGHVVGALTTVQILQDNHKSFAVTLPSGDRRELEMPVGIDSSLCASIAHSVQDWREAAKLTNDQLAALIIAVAFGIPLPSAVDPTDASDHVCLGENGSDSRDCAEGNTERTEETESQSPQDVNISIDVPENEV